MKDTVLDDLLHRSAPAARGHEVGVRVQVDSLSMKAKEQASRGRRGRRIAWAALPVLLVPGIAFATTASTEPRMVPDYSIPVSYTTDTGVSVECTIDFFNGELDYRESSTAQVDYLRGQDWTGIGQRIYDRALVVEADGTADGGSAWGWAEDELIAKTVPDSTFQQGDGGFGSNSDCTGQLH
jgi:hypothetical protein